MQPAFEVTTHPHSPSALSIWLDFEGNSPNAPIEFLVPDAPGVSDDTLEAQLKKAQHEYITTSIRFQQARLAYGQCLAKLARRRATKKRRTNAMISTVFRLPDEIISYIFQFTGRPLLLSRICHRWRAIAIDTPTLWCHFTRNMREIGRPQVTTFLERSRNQPLIVDLIDIGRVVPLLHKVKILNLHLQKHMDIKAICNVPAPLLESMAIVSRPTRPTYLVNLPLFANQAPRLRKVRLEYFIFTKFPTHSVTELTIRNCLLYIEMTVRLQSMPVLQRLTLIDNIFEGFSYEPLDCQLSSLKRLSISYEHRVNIKFIAPKLESLYLSTQDGDYPLVRPGSSLQQLWLGAGFSEGRFKRIHAQLHDVEVLVIVAGNYNSLEEILEVLFEERGSLNFLLPSLRKMFINCEDCPSTEQFADIQKIVQIRNIMNFWVEHRYFSDVVHLMPELDELCCSPLNTLIESDEQYLL